MSSETTDWLLVSDVDDTLLGDDEACEELLHILERTPGVKLVLNSSRPVASVQQTLDELPFDLPAAAIIGAMGTQIFHDGKLLDVWTARFDEWSRESIDAAMAELGFEQHDEEYQTPLKASYDVLGDAGLRDAREAIRGTGQPAKIIRSGDSSFDVLPPNGGKGDATLYVAEIFKVEHEHLIVAGDSANDIAMFEMAQKGIVVGNAREELRDVVDSHRAYHARRMYAGGVLEGLLHYEVPIAVDEPAKK